ncbi:hypothetical protein [Fusobacterium sp. MFO224]|uniref:hypothetical protein n=1 Tax=Fusobacterium sp. MFO224 TaxID=3378070 RepID=UPI003852567A
MIKDKFVVKVYGEPITKNGEEYKNCIECLSSNSIKTIWKYAKQFQESYPNENIVVKERFREGWKEISKMEIED